MPVTDEFPNRSERRAPLSRPISAPRHSEDISRTRLSTFMSIERPPWQSTDTFTVFMTGPSILTSTFVSQDPRLPIYEVTTDNPGGSCAVTILWRLDKLDRSVTEVARITKAKGEKPSVEMNGIRIPVSDFLSKPRWRLRSLFPPVQTFTSHSEVYKWVPQPISHLAESCIWRCAPSNSRVEDPSAALAMYSPRNVSTSNSASFIERPYTPLRRTATNLSKRSSLSFHSTVSSSTNTKRLLGTLRIYPNAGSKPQLREVVVLSFILVLAHKDGWKRIPPSEPSHIPSAESMLARLSESHDPASIAGI